jgi:hypothetical protein
MLDPRSRLRDKRSYWIASISCRDVSLGGHNVKNDIMAFGVASVCS